MTKLTNCQLTVLSAAAAQDNGLAAPLTKMNKAAAAKVGSSLVARKLMREVKARPGTPVWRKDDAGRLVSLMITKAGRQALGVDEAEPGENASNGNKSVECKRAPPRAPNKQVAPIDRVSNMIPAPRFGSKQALVIQMLSGKSGATLDALIVATGWLPHTTRRR